MAAVGAPLPLWAYDATPGLADREYWHYVYDPFARQPTRRLEFGYLTALLEKLFNSFLSDAGTKQDHNCNSDVSRRGGAGVKDAARRGAG